MGVYINGMEMPTKENAVILITPSGDVWMIGDMPNEDTHLVKAKAVTVLPHGRLGDLDALVHDLDDDIENDQRVLDEMDFVGKERERVEFDKNCKQNCLRYLSNAPTIIPASEEDE